MKEVSNLLIVILLIQLFAGCKRCEEILQVGEVVQIPIQFNGFRVSEIDNIMVLRIDNTGINKTDTFRLSGIIWSNYARSTSESITDRNNSRSQLEFGDYGSYFDGCTLILNWGTNSDTLSNFEIKKSKKKVKGCHEDDPNIQIDKFSFIHKGKTISKNESIQINK